MARERSKADLCRWFMCVILNLSCGSVDDGVVSHLYLHPVTFLDTLHACTSNFNQLLYGNVCYFGTSGHSLCLLK